jgi:hypothetical protein
MKGTLSSLWPALLVTLSLALGGNSNRPEKPKKLYRFQTIKGPFYIVEYRKRFYPMFREELLGSYASPEEVAMDLGFTWSFNLLDADLPSLRIPPNLKNWERL